MMARQVSARGGDLRCQWQGDRVLISGRPPPICAERFTCEVNNVFTPGGVLYRADWT